MIVVVYTGFTVLLLYMLQQEKLEKERMKQVVLGIHERQEEEDYQGIRNLLCVCAPLCLFK